MSEEFMVWWGGGKSMYIKALHGCSHFTLTLPLDFEELCHIGEVFLVGLSHLLLCRLGIDNLQSLVEEKGRFIDSQSNPVCIRGTLILYC